MPHRDVLSSSLYSIFTFDCEALDKNSLIVKFADETTESGLITNDCCLFVFVHGQPHPTKSKLAQL